MHCGCSVCSGDLNVCVVFLFVRDRHGTIQQNCHIGHMKIGQGNDVIRIKQVDDVMLVHHEIDVP